MSIFENKKSFVEDELSALLKRICDNIVSVEYIATQNDCKEVVIVTYENKYVKAINVTGDSLYAIVVDVLRGID